MPRKFFRKISPSPETFRQSKHLQFLGDTLHLACLWYLNRRTIARAVAIGLFVMWLPTPMHVLTVAMLAALLRANLPVAVATTFINNPITMAPMFYFDYWVGKHVLSGHYQAFKFEASVHWLTHGLLHIWKPLLTGTLILSSVSAIIGFYGVHLVWRLYLLNHLKERRARKSRSA